MSNSKSNFNQAFWLAVSYTCSMLVGILSSVILSRYFDKVQYGTYKQIIHVYNLLLTVFQAGLPTVFTYFLPRYGREEGKYIVKKVQSLLFILGLLFSLTLFCGSGAIAAVMRNPELKVGLKIFALFPLFTLPAIGVEGIYTVNKNTRFIAFYNIITRLVMLICIVFPVLVIKNDYKLALIGWGAASFVAFIIAIVAKNKAYEDVAIKSIQGLTKEVFKYSTPIMISALVMMVFRFADQFFISRYYGTASFAEYSNGHMTLPFAVMFISPVRSILTPIFSKANKNGDYTNALSTLYNSIRQVTLLMVPLLTLAFCYAKEIMVFLYSSLYENSFVYFRLVILFNFSEMFVFSGLLYAIGKTKVGMIINIICAISLWIIDFIIIRFSSASPFAIAAAFVFMNIMASYFLPGVYLKQKENILVLDRDTIVFIVKITLHCVIVGAVVYFLVQYLMNNVYVLWKLMVGVLSFYLVLLGTSRIFDVNYYSAILRYIKR